MLSPGTELKLKKPSANLNVSSKIRASLLECVEVFRVILRNSCLEITAIPCQNTFDAGHIMRKFFATVNMVRFKTPDAKSFDQARDGFLGIEFFATENINADKALLWEGLNRNVRFGNDDHTDNASIFGVAACNSFNVNGHDFVHVHLEWQLLEQTTNEVDILELAFLCVMTIDHQVRAETKKFQREPPKMRSSARGRLARLFLVRRLKKANANGIIHLWRNLSRSI